jgi:predicted TIM-barrel fold metal-dependent hydrolase
MFASDAPFDTRGGSYFIPRTISDVERGVADEDERAMIFQHNAERILRLDSIHREPSGHTP